MTLKSPPPKVEVESKAIHRLVSGQTDKWIFIGQTGGPTVIEITHIIGLGFSQRRIKLDF